MFKVSNIYPYLNSQNQISDSSKIIAKRFNRLFSGELNELYADEIYGLSKALACKPSQFFEYFNGEGERPIIGLETYPSLNIDKYL